MTHSTAPLKGTPKYRAIVGRLMLTIDESSVAIKTPIATIASTAHLFARCVPAACCCWLSLTAGVRISSLVACVLSDIVRLFLRLSFCLLFHPVSRRSIMSYCNFTTHFACFFFLYL